MRPEASAAAHHVAHSAHAARRHARRRAAGTRCKCHALNSARIRTWAQPSCFELKHRRGVLRAQIARVCRLDLTASDVATGVRPRSREVMRTSAEIRYAAQGRGLPCVKILRSSVRNSGLSVCF
jgi:hypothetical protein